MDHAKVFDYIYETNLWKAGSGIGSLEQNTRHYRWYLQNFLKINRIKSVLDVGCGDWQFSQYIDWSGVDYLGIDVSAVVLANTKKLGRPGVAFKELNAVNDPLPPADLLIAKDVLQHWSNSNILDFIPKLKSYRMALITNGFHPSGIANINCDIQPGNWRPVDLKLSPFNLAGSYVYWFTAAEPKFVFLWCNQAREPLPLRSEEGQMESSS
jgi:SAM-dependent methyltransferase